MKFFLNIEEGNYYEFFRGLTAGVAARAAGGAHEASNLAATGVVIGAMAAFLGVPGGAEMARASAGLWLAQAGYQGFDDIPITPAGIRETLNEVRTGQRTFYELIGNILQANT